MNKLESFFFGVKNKLLIGMIHLPASTGYLGYKGKHFNLEKGLKDLRTLEEAGFDAVLVENDNDQPHQMKVTREIADEFAWVASEIKRASKIPVGIELLYDMEKTFRIADSKKLDFVRLDVFADDMKTKYGVVKASKEKVSKLKNKLDSNVKIIVDIQVKHASIVKPRPIEESTRDSINFGADCVIVTGELTGIPPNINKCEVIKSVSGSTPVLIGSGISTKNCNELLRATNGAIIGTSIKTGEYVDLMKAKLFIKEARKIK